MCPLDLFVNNIAQHTVVALSHLASKLVDFSPIKYKVSSHELITADYKDYKLKQARKHPNKTH